MAAVVLATARVARADSLPALLEVVADRDDDDLNGVPDAEETFAAKGARVDMVPLGDSFVGVTLTPRTGGEHARLLVDGRPLAWGTRLPRGAVVQGVSPGTVVLEARQADATSAITLSVFGLGLRGGDGRDVDLTHSHASLDRSPPSQLTGDAASLYDEPDPLRLFVVTPESAPPAVTVESVGPTGAHLDALSAPALSRVPCADAAAPLRCFASDPIRFVIDDVDRRHALAAGRSVRAELGGAIVLRRDGKKEQAIRVLGPRDSPAGPIGRLRATLRPFVLRFAPGGVPAIGGTDAGAVASLRAELSTAAAAWGECGVTFGPPGEIPVRLVDPPPRYLLAIGDDLGLPASGGRVRFRIDGKQVVDVATRPGDLPDAVAHEVARAIERAGSPPSSPGTRASQRAPTGAST